MDRRWAMRGLPMDGRMADGADAEMAAMESLTRFAPWPWYQRSILMPSQECCLERRMEAVPSSCRLRPTAQEYRVSTPAKGLLVFSEIHYPEGWQLTIDGDRLICCASTMLPRCGGAPPESIRWRWRLCCLLCSPRRTMASAGSGLLLAACLWQFCHGLSWAAVPWTEIN